MSDKGKYNTFFLAFNGFCDRDCITMYITALGPSDLGLWHLQQRNL
jgi:hypothetical protein